MSGIHEKIRHFLGIGDGHRALFRFLFGKGNRKIDLKGKKTCKFLMNSCEIFKRKLLMMLCSTKSSFVSTCVRDLSSWSLYVNKITCSWWHFFLVAFPLNILFHLGIGDHSTVRYSSIWYICSDRPDTL